MNSGFLKKNSRIPLSRLPSVGWKQTESNLRAYLSFMVQLQQGDVVWVSNLVIAGMNDYVWHREFLSIFYAKVSMIRISFIGTHSEILNHNVAWTCSTIGSGKVGSWSRIPTHFHGNPASRNSIFAIPKFYLRYPDLLSSLSRTYIFTIPNFYLRYFELLSSPSLTSIFAIPNIVFFHNPASVLEIWGISRLSSQVTYLLNVSRFPKCILQPRPQGFPLKTFLRGKPSLPPALWGFLSFFLDDKTSAPDVFSSCSFIPRAHLETSLRVMTSSGCSSHFWVKMYVFQLFSTIKVRLVDEWCKVHFYVLFSC